MSFPAATFPQTAAALATAEARGLHLGAQVCVSLRGSRVLDLAVGDDEPGRPLTRDAWMVWMSTTKPIAAVAMAQLWERDLCDLDDPITRHVPEFGVAGKETITLRHALTHTGGFRMLDVGWPRLSWEETITKICAARREPRWEPGEKAGYHQASSWFMLGEVVRRLSGEPFDEYVRRHLFEPLGMKDSWIGMPPEVYERERGRLAATWDTSGETPRRMELDSELHATRCSPASGGRGPMGDLVTFYEMLLGHGQRHGVRILMPQTVEALAARHRVGMYDYTFKHVMDWGLGFIPDSKQYGDAVPYAYGRHASRHTFGHSGYRSSTAFADPKHNLALAIAFNGLPSDETHEVRMRAVVEAVYEDLGLVESPDETTVR